MPRASTCQNQAKQKTLEIHTHVGKSEGISFRTEVASGETGGRSGKGAKGGRMCSSLGVPGRPASMRRVVCSLNN